MNACDRSWLLGPLTDCETVRYASAPTSLKWMKWLGHWVSLRSIRTRRLGPCQFDSVSSMPVGVRLSTYATWPYAGAYADQRSHWAIAPTPGVWSTRKP